MQDFINILNPHMRFGIAKEERHVDDSPNFLYNVFCGGKDMSLLCTLKNKNGIVMAADSRLVNDVGIVTDKAMKVFKSRYFILGATGTAEAVQDNSPTLMIDDIINDLLKQNDYMRQDEFLQALEEKINYACSYIKQPDYYFVFGYKENNQYLVRSCNIGKNCRHNLDAVYLSDICFNTGYYTLAPTDIKVGADWDLQKMETTASSMVRSAIEWGDMFEDINPIGGMVQTVHFV